MYTSRSYCTYLLDFMGTVVWRARGDEEIVAKQHMQVTAAADGGQQGDIATEEEMVSIFRSKLPQKMAPCVVSKAAMGQASLEVTS